MKSLILILLFIAGIVSVQAAITANETRAAQMAACFRMHGQMMEKPAVKNIYRCWYEHAYLMDRR